MKANLLFCNNKVIDVKTIVLWRSTVIQEKLWVGPESKLIIIYSIFLRAMDEIKEQGSYLLSRESRILPMKDFTLCQSVGLPLQLTSFRLRWWGLVVNIKHIIAMDGTSKRYQPSNSVQANLWEILTNSGVRIQNKHLIIDPQCSKRLITKTFIGLQKNRFLS